VWSWDRHECLENNQSSWRGSLVSMYIIRALKSSPSTEDTCFLLSMQQGGLIIDLEKKNIDPKQVGEHWDNPHGVRTSSLSVLRRVVAGVLSKRRLPTTGWIRSAIRSSRFQGGWWNNSFIDDEVSMRICGKRVGSRSAGVLHFLQTKTAGEVFQRGISVGCGDGQKEAVFIQAGLVGHFDLFELSRESIARGRVLAESQGLSDQMTFHHLEESVFESVGGSEIYDFVSWNDALHHMPDVFEAVAWSRKVLRNQGVFCMDEYVGPTRMQWSDAQLAAASSVRRSLHERYMAKPSEPFGGHSVKVKRPTIEEMIAMDPSEAVDSERIMSAVKEYFPQADIRDLGGVVFFLAMNEMSKNFDSDRDREILQLLMLVDQQLLDAGHSIYAVAIARKG
jgi:SAM-dependent methyltransferase